MKKISRYYKSFFPLLLIVLLLAFLAGCNGVTPSNYGSIDMNSTPAGAKVYLDGEDTGQVTPIILTGVEAGTHTIQLDKFHYKIWGDTVIVIANNTIYRNPPLTYASPQSITLQPGAEGKDALMDSFNPDNNYGNLYYFYVGKSYASYGRAYLQFDLSTIPADARIIDADLKLYQFNSAGSGNFQIGLYKVIDNWEEHTITCNYKPNNSSETEALCTVYTGFNIWIGWNIDDLVQGWLDGSITNQGMVLKSTDETLGSGLLIHFYSSDYADATERPKLEIHYYIP